MSNDCALWLRRCLLIFALVASAFCAPDAQAELGGWHSPPNHMLPPVGEEPEAAPATPPAAPRMSQPVDVPHHAPMARLIMNPDQSSGTPPYALTDQNGAVQRYVEPVPGVDLAAHVGQIVTVHNDTGPTLLATQLDLPRERLYPMVSELDRGAAGAGRELAFQPRRQFASDSHVVPVQYMDNDDSSVQLLPDDMPNAGPPMGVQNYGGELPLIGQNYPGYPGQSMPGEMCGPGCGPQCCDQQCCDPMQCGPGMMQQPFVGPMVGPCPECGGYHNAPGCGPQQCCNQSAQTCEDQGPHLSGDVEFMFYRVHMTETAVGKLSETYQFTPRFILNFRGIGNLDGRIRYWFYERDTEVLSGGSIRLEFNVLDIEATHRFEGRRSQLTLSAGLRLADLQLIDTADQQCGSNMLGLTMAADGLTPLVCMSGGYCGWVYGGRVSLLGGDWGGDNASVFINGQFRDDNVLVTELYAGAEVARKCRNVTVRGRALFEMQNWRSDVLAQNAGIESIGFIGPAVQLGADF